jgi:CRISPR-associated protein Cmr6
MSGWYTRQGRPDRRQIARRLAGLSPSLLYHKWHAYDLESRRGGAAVASFRSREALKELLEDVARAVNQQVAGAGSTLYADWYERYWAALRGVGVDDPKDVLDATTVWRLVAGFATNPALETGITLHPLYGVPYLPGSAVRGLVRHVAEIELLERELPADQPTLESFLVEAERRRILLGSLTIEPLEKGSAEKTARTVLAAWRKDRRLPPEIRKRIAVVLDQHTGGMATFYDAFPVPGQEGILQLDLLNPHYPDYYNSQGGKPPSDDQNPTPVYFLAVKPEAKFRFPFRIAALPAGEDLDDVGKERVVRLAGVDPREAVLGWLTRGLKEWGAGAKTAAGYGYFSF